MSARRRHRRWPTLIARYVTPEFVKRIAAEQRKGRRLLMGTTHLDAQRPVIWDMGGIAIRDVGGSVSVDYHFVEIAWLEVDQCTHACCPANPHHVPVKRLCAMLLERLWSSMIDRIFRNLVSLTRSYVSACQE